MTSTFFSYHRNAVRRRLYDPAKFIPNFLDYSFWKFHTITSMVFAYTRHCISYDAFFQARQVFPLHSARDKTQVNKLEMTQVCTGIISGKKNNCDNYKISYTKTICQNKNEMY